MCIGAPQDDCLYSVRFSELSSAGAIVYSNGRVLPFNKDIVDWIWVILPQREVNSTLLRPILKEKRCDMRRRGFEFFQKYLVHSSGRLRAIVYKEVHRLQWDKSPFLNPFSIDFFCLLVIKSLCIQNWLRHLSAFDIKASASSFSWNFRS
jgi:hypothetical protein